MAAGHRGWAPKAERRWRGMNIQNHSVLQVAWYLVAKFKLLSCGLTIIYTILHNAWILQDLREDNGSNGLSSIQ